MKLTLLYRNTPKMAANIPNPLYKLTGFRMNIIDTVITKILLVVEATE